MVKHRPSTKVVSLVIFLAWAGAGLAQESASYVADRTTVTAVAGRASSAGYVIEATLGEIHPVGSASFCNVGFTNSTGFWSVLGDSQVPIVLMLAHDPGDPVTALLSWTGSYPQFEVLRSASAADVLDPLNLLTTTAGCDAADPDPPAATVFFYMVVPAGSVERTP
jgi:hypothetical protein